MRAPSPAVTVIGLVLAVCGLVAGCSRGPAKPLHRERVAARDGDCREPAKPHAFLYPAENRTDYGPDDPKADGCALIVPDHLFCCPEGTRPSDR